MKYLTLASFEKHLQSPGSSVLYAVISPCRYERKKIIAAILKAHGTPEEVLQVDGEEVVISDFIGHLSTCSLWGGTVTGILESVDKLKKKDKEALIAYVANPSPKALCILGSPSGKGVQDLYQAGKKEMIACDLSQEKPWEKKKRLEKMLIDGARALGKNLPIPLAVTLVEQIGPDLSALEQELHKICLFCSGRGEIRLEDVTAISAVSIHTLSWQFVEDLVFSDAPKVPDQGSYELIPLIGQLRYQLELALQIGSCLERHLPVEEIATHFPQMQRPQLEKKIHVIQKKSLSYFARALHHLFEMELLAKNSSVEPGLLLDLFLYKKAESHV